MANSILYMLCTHNENFPCVEDTSKEALIFCLFRNHLNLSMIKEKGKICAWKSCGGGKNMNTFLSYFSTAFFKVSLHFAEFLWLIRDEEVSQAAPNKSEVYARKKNTARRDWQKISHGSAWFTWETFLVYDSLIARDSYDLLIGHFQNIKSIFINTFSISSW